MNIAPVAGKLFVDWAVAGIDPALSGIEAGKLPKGSIVGTNSLGKQGYRNLPRRRGNLHLRPLRVAHWALAKAGL